MAHSPDSIITTELISLDTDLGTAKETVIATLAQRLTDNGRATSAETLRDAALAREAQSATGLPGGIAIPHCRNAAVTNASLGFARLEPAVDFGAADGPADLVFLTAAPEGAGAEHMKLLPSLARALVRPEFVGSLRGAASADEVVSLVTDVLTQKPAMTPKTTAVRTQRVPEVPLARADRIKIRWKLWRHRPSSKLPQFHLILIARHPVPRRATGQNPGACRLIRALERMDTGDAREQDGRRRDGCA